MQMHVAIRSDSVFGHFDFICHLNDFDSYSNLSTFLDFSVLFELCAQGLAKELMAVKSTARAVYGMHRKMAHEHTREN